MDGDAGTPCEGCSGATIAQRKGSTGCQTCRPVLHVTCVTSVVHTVYCEAQQDTIEIINIKGTEVVKHRPFHAA